MHYRNRFPIQIFDCDGVILKSNDLKIFALEDSLNSVGLSRSFVDFAADDFRRNFGRTRIGHFNSFRDAAMQSGIVFTQEMMSTAMIEYSQRVVKLYENCDVITETVDYIDRLPLSSEIFVVSASDESELRSILPRKVPRISTDKTYGGPRSKVSNIANLISQWATSDCIFYGDAVQDAKASIECGIEFCGLARYSAHPQTLVSFCEKNDLVYFNDCLEVPVG